MNKPGNKILARMLDRLFAAIVSGPSLNCRPHASRHTIYAKADRSQHSGRGQRGSDSDDLYRRSYVHSRRGLQS